MTNPRIFISYSHEDGAWKDMLVTYLKPFVYQDDIVLWDDRKIGTGTDWYPAIKEEIKRADISICLVSADFLASDFINKEEIPDMKRRRKDEGMLLLPLLLSPCPWKGVKWLKEIQMFPRDGVSLEELRTKVLQKKAMAEFVEEIHGRIAAEDFTTPVPVPKFAPPEKVEISRLPETGSQLFGREKELRLLDEMWDSASANVVSLVAWGGVGKSTLVNQWLRYLGADNYRGAKRVFGWSFYSQGTGQRVTSADQFISEALTWFGDPDAKRGSPWDKGERLAALVRRQRTLLVLDGLEPLQSDSAFEKGKINDPALSILVTQLARQNNALCVVTTRQKVAELEQHPKTALQVDLDQISREAGRALLRVGGAQGTDEELEAASEAFGNHALAVRLVGAYLQGIEGHHISNASSIPDLDIPNEKGRQPRRVMETFDRRFGESPQRQMLCIMGLFDRPPDLAYIEAVKAPPPIVGLTERLSDLTEGQWRDLLDELRGYGLLAAKSKHNPGVLDCHPLVREHFGEKLKGERPDAWREAHKRLYEHLCKHKEGDQPTLEDLQPLYQAVAHGCQAGLQQQACDDVYFDRIVRRNENYSAHKLGALGSDLGAEACFFEQPWSRVSPALNEVLQAWMLNEAAYRLRALGRLNEALEPMRAGMESRLKLGQLDQAAISASNLSELELTLGAVAGAVGDAEQSVTYANRSGDANWTRLSCITEANALHQAGRGPEAEKLFREAEEMQKKMQPHYPLLYSLPGFLYCDLLLAAPERAAWQTILQLKTQNSALRTATASCRAVSQRAAQIFEWRKLPKWNPAYDPLLDIALDHLTLGRAALYEAILSKSKTCGERGRTIGNQKSEIEQAVSGLRNANQQDELPKALLTRALLRFLEGRHTGSESAQADLDEAWETAERGPMKLFMADIHLYRARLFCREKPYPWESPHADLAAAEKIIRHETTYRKPDGQEIKARYARRDGELADAQEAAKNW